MSDEEVDLWADALLLKIHTVTGWVIPESAILNIITDQFRKKLLESYSRCNPDEIEYAFRNYGTSVKDWGKNMNLSLIDEVMTPYLTQRTELSKIEEQIRLKEDFKELPPPEMTDQEIIDTAWDVWLATDKLDYISESTYEVLDKHRMIVLSNEEKKKLMNAANTYLVETEVSDKLDRLATQKRYAKKMAVARLFKQHKEIGVKVTLP